MVLHKKAEASKGTIFFIHGSMARMSQFRAQIDHFVSQGTYDVVAYDYYGCGRSPKDSTEWSDYATEAHSRDLRLLYERYGSGNGVNVLVAHSFGCTLAVRLVASIERAAHVAPPRLAFLLGGGVPDEAKRAQAARIFSLLSALRMLHPLLSRGFRERAIHPSTTDEELLRFCAATSGANPMHVVQPFYCQAQFLVRQDAANASRQATEFVCVCGEGDKLTPPSACEELASEWLKGAKGGASFRLVPRAAHQVMQERPALVCRIIDEALAA